MASGDTLAVFTATNGMPPATNFATIDTRNSTYTLCFDATTSEGTVFLGVLPRNYAGGGITVSVAWAAASATTGTIGWLVAIERLQGGTDTIASDSFAADQTITAATVPGTAGIVSYTTVAITNGASMDSLAVGEAYRLRLRRDTANDTATGDAEFLALEIKET